MDRCATGSCLASVATWTRAVGRVVRGLDLHGASTVMATGGVNTPRDIDDPVVHLCGQGGRLADERTVPRRYSDSACVVEVLTHADALVNASPASERQREPLSLESERRNRASGVAYSEWRRSSLPSS